jgi:predicted permease
MAIARDLLKIIRQLLKAPGFTLAAILSLAFGIGANAAIFTLLDALLLRPLPVQAPAQLVQIGPAGSVADHPGAVLSLLLNGLASDPTVQGVCGFLTPLSNLETTQPVKPVSALALTGDCFQTLGIRPALGRLFGPAESERNAPKVAVISYDLWQQDYHGDADVIGKIVRVEGQPATIIGVTERRFSGLMLGFPAKVSFPIEQFMQPPPGMDGQQIFMAYLRRKAGISVSEMRAHLSVLWPRLLKATVPADYQGAKRDDYLKQKLLVVPASGGVDYTLRGQFGGPLWALLGLTGLVLVVSCVNVANLMLARGLERRREMALRVALGARRWLLIRQLAIESLVLIVAGIACGLAFAYAADHLLIVLFQARSTGFELSLSPDSRVLVFAAVAAGLVLLLVGLWPAFRNTDIDTASALKEAGRSVAGLRGRARRILIAGQVALTLVLLTGSAVFIQHLRSLESVPLGFQAAGLLDTQLMPLPGEHRTSSSLAAYDRELLENLKSLPGVESASLSTDAPLFHLANPQPVTKNSSETSTISANSVVVDDSFFSTMQIPLLAGSGFRNDDTPSSPKVAIISQVLAHRLFPEGKAIGQRLNIGPRGEGETVIITGIAANARLFSLRGGEESIVYLNYWQHLDPRQWRVVLVRTAGDPRNLFKAVENKIRAAGREYPTYIRTLQFQADMSLMRERLLAWLATAFGLVALTLAAIGLHGLLAYYVNSRTAEIGVRMALGAERRQVQWLVLREALALVAIGVIAGVPGAYALLRLVASVLPGAATIVLPMLIAAATLTTVGVFAAWRPAWIASRLDPMTALRHE